MFVTSGIVIREELKFPYEKAPPLCLMKHTRRNCDLLNSQKLKDGINTSIEATKKPAKTNKTNKIMNSCFNVVFQRVFPC